MFAYLLAEWREWTKSLMAKTLIAGVAVAALVGAFASVQPTIAMMCLCGQSLWLGWYLGNRYWRGSSERSRYLSGSLPAWKAVAGKTGAALLIASVHAASMAPFLVLTAVVWGLDPGSVLACLSICFASFLLALSLGFCFSFALSGGEGFFGTVAMGAWLILSAAIAPARAANPFIQIWLAMSGSEALSLRLSAPVLLAASAAILAATAPLLERLRKTPHE